MVSSLHLETRLHTHYKNHTEDGREEILYLVFPFIKPPSLITKHSDSFLSMCTFFLSIMLILSNPMLIPVNCFKPHPPITNLIIWELSWHSWFPVKDKWGGRRSWQPQNEKGPLGQTNTSNDHWRYFLSLTFQVPNCLLRHHSIILILKYPVLHYFSVHHQMILPHPA